VSGGYGLEKFFGSLERVGDRNGVLLVFFHWRLKPPKLTGSLLKVAQKITCGACRKLRLDKGDFLPRISSFGRVCMTQKLHFWRKCPITVEKPDVLTVHGKCTVKFFFDSHRMAIPDFRARNCYPRPTTGARIHIGQLTNSLTTTSAIGSALPAPCDMKSRNGCGLPVGLVSTGTHAGISRSLLRAQAINWVVHFPKAKTALKRSTWSGCWASTRNSEISA